MAGLFKNKHSLYIAVIAPCFVAPIAYCYYTIKEKSKGGNFLLKIKYYFRFKIF